MHNTVAANVEVLRTNSLHANNVTAGNVIIDQRRKGVSPVASIAFAGVAGGMGYGLGRGVGYEFFHLILVLIPWLADMSPPSGK
jgi:hypothetical protein